MKKGDLIIIAAVAVLEIILAAAFLRPYDPGATAVIEQGGHELHRIALSDDGREILVRGELGEVLIRVEDGAVFFKSSECPDRTCVNSGRLRRAGQTAACVPNRVLVRIEGGGEDGEPDAVLR